MDSGGIKPVRGVTRSGYGRSSLTSVRTIAEPELGAAKTVTSVPDPTPAARYEIARDALTQQNGSVLVDPQVRELIYRMSDVRTSRRSETAEGAKRKLSAYLRADATHTDDNIVEKKV
jgi:hypothetical protein